MHLSPPDRPPAPGCLCIPQEPTKDSKKEREPGGPQLACRVHDHTLPSTYCVRWAELQAILGD